MNDKGMSTIEYAMMTAFIICVAVLGIELFGKAVKSLVEVAVSVLP